MNGVREIECWGMRWLEHIACKMGLRNDCKTIVEHVRINGRLILKCIHKYNVKV
jgi:hypothetical protein